MGMDIYGTKPTTETGAYFRNNVWWWRPLATFLTDTYPDLTAPCTYWQSNDGDGLNSKQTTALADALDADLANGRIEEYADMRKRMLDLLPTTTCRYCEGTGIRADRIGQSLGLDKPRDPATGLGGCNACGGTGQEEPPERSYPFTVENVRDFAAFLRTSGGFAIH